MFAVDEDRRRDVMHDFTGVAAVGLYQVRQWMASVAVAYRVGGNALGPVVCLVEINVAPAGESSRCDRLAESSPDYALARGFGQHQIGCDLSATTRLD